MESGQHQFYLDPTLPQTAVRRTHTKSRNGCLPCKRLHLKCSEERPTCRACLKKKKPCQYSPISKRKSVDKSALSPPRRARLKAFVPAAAPSAVSPSFTLLDLELFHHFLCFAYPPLPLGNKSTWTRDVALLSHHSKPLMSALLALSATHVNSTRPHDDRLATARSHKERAVKGLIKMCASDKLSATDLDVMLAISYALTFQSSLSPCDFSEFATFCKGCASVTEQIQSQSSQSVFVNLPAKVFSLSTQCADSRKLEASRFRRNAQAHSQLLAKGIVSIGSAQKLLHEQYGNSTPLTALQSMLNGFQISVATGYSRFATYYSVWFKVAQNHVFSQVCIDDDGGLVWAYVMAVHLLTALMVIEDRVRDTHDFSAVALGPSSPIMGMQGMVEWLYAVEGRASPLYQRHLAWPRLVACALMERFDTVQISEAGISSKMEALENLRTHKVLGDLLGLAANLANWTAELLASGDVEEV
jgi:hypothetical protein